MQNTMSVEQTIKNIWNQNNRMRGAASVSDNFPSILYVLYGYHKQYPCMKVNDEVIFNNTNDLLLNYIYKWAFKPNINKANSWQLYKEIESISYEVFETSYEKLLCVVIKVLTNLK